jgi:3-oxoacyl-[acyl-carrier protein] reductase
MPFLEATEEHFDSLVAANLRSAYFSSQAAARVFVAQGGGGRLILTSSVQGSLAVPDHAAYAMTKAGVAALARNLAVELGPHGVTVNAVVPGPITNRRNLDDDPRYDDRWAEMLPAARVGAVADVAALVVFLASGAAAFITGTSIPVDGGWLATGWTADTVESTADALRRIQ